MSAEQTLVLRINLFIVWREQFTFTSLSLLILQINDFFSVLYILIITKQCTYSECGMLNISIFYKSFIVIKNENSVQQTTLVIKLWIYNSEFSTGHSSFNESDGLIILVIPNWLEAKTVLHRKFVINKLFQ